jgi:hypothetical protein
VSDLELAIRFLNDMKSDNPGADKERLQAEFDRAFAPQRRRSLFIGRGYALRFSQAQGSAFSNTVLSLSALQGVDHQPLVVTVVGLRTLRFILANSTFLKKISHSSHHLRVDNVKGSFNGTDIITDYEGLRNEPENFELLFAMHSAFTWSENLERLVEATNAIVGRDRRFRPTDGQRRVILDAPERAAIAALSGRFAELENQLRVDVGARQEGILQAATVENVNIRGNRIEQLVTGGANAHELGDLRRALDAGDLVIDVKAKLSDRASAPKAYNIDKMLAFHAEPGSVFAFLILGVDVLSGTVTVRLVPVLDRVLLEATVIQHHWAGRTSRGVTQLSGRFDHVLAPGFTPSVDVARARAFLVRLLDG